MADAKEIFKKPIGYFLERGIDNFRIDSEKTINDLLKVYFENGGFVVVCYNNLVSGYLDVSDTAHVRKLAESSLKTKIKTSRLLQLNSHFVLRSESINSVIDQLNVHNRVFFPVVDNRGHLRGRVSKGIIRDKIDQIYDGLGIFWY